MYQQQGKCTNDDDESDCHWLAVPLAVPVPVEKNHSANAYLLSVGSSLYQPRENSLS
jgi:hypothetical protein